MINKFYLFLLLYCLTSFGLLAQSIPGDASQFLKRLSPAEGLSQSYVTKTVQDNQGYIWVATEMGLNRYDGYRVTKVSGPNNVFSKSHISTLFIDEQGYLWVSVAYTGLFRIDTSTLLAEQFFNGKVDPNAKGYLEVETIIQGENNDLWLGISESVYHLDVNTKKLSLYFSLKTKDDLVRDLILKGDSLYCATSDGLYRINIKTKEANLIPHKPSSVTSRDSTNTKLLIFDNKGGLMVGTVDGLYYLSRSYLYEAREEEPRTLILGFNIWDVQQLENKYLVATNEGLFEYDPKNLTLEFILKFSNSIYKTTDNNILDLFKDSNNNIWLASKSHGVMVWSYLVKRFQHISSTSEMKLNNDNVWALYQDKDEFLWIATDNGINKLDLVAKKSTVYLASKDKKQVRGKHVVRSIFPNSKDENLLWIVNDDGLYVFNKNTGEIELPFYTKSSKELIKDQWTGGLFVLDNQRIVFFNERGHYLYNSQKGEVEPLAALNDKFDVDLTYSFLGFLPGDNNVVFLAVSGHLYSYNLTNHDITLIYSVQNYQAQAFDYVDNWVLDDNNILWIAMTGEGLIGIDYQTLKVKYHYDSSNKLTTNHIYALQLDEFNQLWFSSQEGLFRLDLNTHFIEHYTTEDGLVSNEFNGYSFARLADQRLVYGSPLGITIFSPKEFNHTTKKNNKKLYKVSLTGLSLLSDPNRTFSDFSNNSEILLAHDDYGLKLQFSTMAYSKQKRTLYNIDITGSAPYQYSNYNNNELVLPKLAPGHQHKIAITAINPNTGELSQPFYLIVKELYAPWFSPKAKVGFLILIICSLAWYLSNRNFQANKLATAYEKLKVSENQVQSALKGSNSDVWDFNLKDNEVYENRISNELGYRNMQLPITIEKHQSLMDIISRKALSTSWSDFIQGEGDVWDVTYQMRTVSDDFLWFRDVGRAIEWDELGKPTRISGTYTNITEIKANKIRAELFGEAFSQIDNRILIIATNKVPVSANKAFTKEFCTEGGDLESSFHYFLQLLGDNKQQQFYEIIEQLSVEEYWVGEEQIETQKGSLYPIQIKINAIANDNMTIGHYVIVISDISLQKKAENKLKNLANYDYLTKLPNRRYIFENIELAIKHCTVTKEKFALLFIDLDKFKLINDSLGHSVGDELLIAVAKILTKNVKNRDMVARQSGDEFIILINSMTNTEDIGSLACRVNECLTKPMLLDGNQVVISSSIGISIFPSDGINAKEMIKNADLAMIHAKRKGCGQFEFFTAEMDEEANQRLIIENKLKEAVKQQELVNFYQPIVNNKKQTTIGFELLLRWNHEGEMISPATFIPVAEDLGLIIEITESAIERALIDYKKWQKKHPNTYISINISAIHILQEGLCELLLSLLDKYQLTPEVLRLEITEGTLLADLNIALVRLNHLKGNGFKLLLDDFGTGYSSLTYLSKFPIDVIKIDKSFILNLNMNPVNKAIVKAIIALAKSLNITCIAEGVETIEQLEFVETLKCEAIQGYYFAKPMPVENIMIV